MKKILTSLLSFYLIGNFFLQAEIKEIDSVSSFRNLLSASEVIVADFYATWCPPCKTLAPLLHSLAEDPQWKGKVTFVRVDIDQFTELAEEYDVGGIPDVRFFYKGKMINKIIGLADKDDYIKAIKELM